jgi:hypothetical protein
LMLSWSGSGAGNPCWLLCFLKRVTAWFALHVVLLPCWPPDWLTLTAAQRERQMAQNRTANQFGGVIDTVSSSDGWQRASAVWHHYPCQLALST